MNEWNNIDLYVHMHVWSSLFDNTPSILHHWVSYFSKRRKRGSLAILQLASGKLDGRLRLSILGKHMDIDLDHPFLGVKFHPQTVCFWWFFGGPNFRPLEDSGICHIGYLLKYQILDLGSCVASRVLIFSRMAERKCKSLGRRKPLKTADDHFWSVDPADDFPGWFSKLPYLKLNVFKLNGGGWTRQVILKGMIIHDRYSWHTLTSCVSASTCFDKAILVILDHMFSGIKSVTSKDH